MTTTLGGYMGRVMRVDLTTREVTEYPWEDDDRRAWPGGKTMAAKVLFDSLDADCDPLGPENVVVISTGPLTGTGAPSTSRFNISALSPLTGTVGSSNCGGSFGIHLKRAGVDALVITGTSPTPVWLEVADDGRIDFRDASDLRDAGTGATQEAIRASVGEACGSLAIGPAGERLVRFACVVSDDRAAGRTGIGAVFGSKNLKGVAAHGSAKVPIARPDEFHRHAKRWTARLKAHPLTGEALPAFGTGGFLPRMQELGIVGTSNYRSGRFDGVDAISGQALAKGRLVGTTGCRSCPIKCGRVVEVAGCRVKGPELETLALLGANLGNADLDRIIEWNLLLDDLGMDTISAGSTIGFATELAERGLAPFPLAFGETDGIAELIEDIAYRRGIGDELADGTRRLAERYGAREAAMHVKGLEIAAYDPRRAVGHGLGYATSNRGGCHLNGGYVVALEGLTLRMGGRSSASKPALAAMFQDLMEAVSAVGGCLFTTYAIFPAALVRAADRPLGKAVAGVLAVSAPVLRALRALPSRALAIPMPLVPHIKALETVTGERVGFGPFWAAGERGFTIERLLGRRFGLTAADDTLPGRDLDEPIDSSDSRSVVALAPMLRRYYAQRGWDPAGVPGRALLRRLRLDDTSTRSSQENGSPAAPPMP